MSKMFRLLRADEIDCRVAQCKEGGLSLLLYKDARCDMNILDETVGEFNWQRRHSRDNANCEVGIYSTVHGQWIWKEDTGTESQSEAEKGLASDSFKRACFNWGIGRELYTAPFIWIGADQCKISVSKDGRAKSFDKFYVSQISYNDNSEIDGLVINRKGDKDTGYVDTEVFTFGTLKKSKAVKKPEPTKPKPISDMQFDSVTDALTEMNRTAEGVCKHYGIGAIRDMNTDQYTDFMKIFNDWRMKNNA